MKKRFFSLQKELALSVLLLFTAVMTGCKPQTEIQEVYYYVTPLENDDPLIGDWYNISETYSEKYTITENSFDNQWGYGNPVVWNDSYAGNNLYVLKLSETSGTIFFKFTRAATPSYSYSTDPSEAPDVGNWYAISYKDLNSSKKTVNLSGAYKAGGQTSCQTLQEAVNEFTIAHGYFASYSALTSN